jgi:hypothetical protein
MFPSAASGFARLVMDRFWLSIRFVRIWVVL